MYVPGVEALTSIVPVDALIDNPAGELEYVPPGVTGVGVGSAAFTQ